MQQIFDCSEYPGLYSLCLDTASGYHLFLKAVKSPKPVKFLHCAGSNNNFKHYYLLGNLKLFTIPTLYYCPHAISI